jgi:hypothetical protein
LERYKTISASSKESRLLNRIVIVANAVISIATPMSPPARARQVTSAATYTLKATPKTVEWGYYDAKAVPVLRIKPGVGGLYPAKRVIL